MPVTEYIGFSVSAIQWHVAVDIGESSRIEEGITSHLLKDVINQVAVETS